MSLSSPAPASPHRSLHYPELDALRGLAAFVVVLGHYSRLWDFSSLGHTAQILIGTVFHPFFNGGSSVILFFLLSGFVLALPYKRGNELPYGTFALRRLARIYLPYLAALLLALLGDWHFHQPMHVSEWFSRTWTAPLNFSLILQNFLLIGNYDTAQVNTAFWSLAVEMRLSFLFPLLCIPLLRWRRRFVVVALAVLVLLQFGTQHLLASRLDIVSMHNLSDMMLGVLSFAGGILLARRLEWVQAVWTRKHSVQHMLFFAASFLLLEWLELLQPSHLSLLKGFLVIAGGAGVLVVTLCSRRISLILNHRLPAWLGRVSYSLYLVHATVLFTLVHLFLGPLTRLQLLVPYLVCALVFAAIFFFIVEKPCIHLSRSIGRRGRTLSNLPRASTDALIHPGDISA